MMLRFVLSSEWHPKKEWDWDLGSASRETYIKKEKKDRKQVTGHNDCYQLARAVL